MNHDSTSIVQFAAQSPGVWRNKKSFWLTLMFGALLIGVSLVLLFFVDLPARGWMRTPQTLVADMPAPVGRLQTLARWVALNMTGLCWVGFLFVFDGLLGLTPSHEGDGSPLRCRLNRFLVIWLTSIPVWCFFDAVNFYGMHAWDYHGLPPRLIHRLGGYFVAFAAISPGMFLAAELFQRLGLRRLTTVNPRLRRAAPWCLSLGVMLIISVWIAVLAWVQYEQRGSAFAWSVPALIGPGLLTVMLSRRLMPTSFVFGLCFSAWAIWVRAPIGNLTLWVGLIYLLDPMVFWLRRGEANGDERIAPSILHDWTLGRFGRTMSLMLGGALCGLCWEFWNYWALAKWTYHLPFVGALEHDRYFEMPLIGFMGFLPFAVECWIMFHFLAAIMQRLSLRLVEPLPSDEAVM